MAPAALKLERLAEFGGGPEQQQTTLLELVAAVAESAETDDEVIATVSALLNSGKVTLVGNFRRADVRVG